MALWTRIANALNQLSGGAVAATFNEAATAYDDDPRASEYRRLSDTKRDLMPYQFDRQRELAYYLWQRNPIARRMIDALVQFTTGDEVSVKVRIMARKPDGTVEETENESAQVIFDEFWRDPVNDMANDLPTFIQDLLISGELVLPVVQRIRQGEDGSVAGDGFVRLGFADPSNVVEAIPDPLNVRQIRTLVMQHSGGEKYPLRVVGPDPDPKSPTYGMLVGQAIYWRLNRVTNQSRGHSHLIDELDWLDLLDQFLFDALHGFQSRNTFFWSVEMKGMNEGQLKEKQSSFSVPATGAARLHNENTKYEAMAPDLGSVEVDKALLSMQTFIVGAKGYPLTWFGTGEDSNRASAAEMAVPTMRMLKAFQKNVKALIRYIAKYVVDSAIMARRMKLKENEYIDVDVTLFDFERRDAAVMGAAFQQMTAALSVAVEKNWASDETAKKTVDAMLGRLGIEIDEKETVEQLRQDAKDRKAEDDEDTAEDIYRNNPFPTNGDERGDSSGSPGNFARTRITSP